MFYVHVGMFAALAGSACALAAVPTHSIGAIAVLVTTACTVLIAGVRVHPVNPPHQMLRIGGEAVIAVATILACVALQHATLMWNVITIVCALVGHLIVMKVTRSVHRTHPPRPT